MHQRLAHEHDRSIEFSSQKLSNCHVLEIEMRRGQVDCCGNALVVHDDGFIYLIENNPDLGMHPRIQDMGLTSSLLYEGSGVREIGPRGSW